MKNIWLLIFTVLALIAIVGCTQPAAASEIKSDKPRETSPSMTPADAAALTQGNGTLALNLYHLLKDFDGNLFVSPYSISEALAMTYGGAQGDTAKQMATALQFTLSQNQLHAAFNNVDIEPGQTWAGSPRS